MSPNQEMSRPRNVVHSIPVEMLAVWQVTILWLEPYVYNWSIAGARKHLLISSGFYCYCFILSVLKHVRNENSGRMLRAPPGSLAGRRGDSSISLAWP